MVRDFHVKIQVDDRYFGDNQKSSLIYVLQDVIKMLETKIHLQNLNEQRLTLEDGTAAGVIHVSELSYPFD